MVKFTFDGHEWRVRMFRQEDTQQENPPAVSAFESFADYAYEVFADIDLDSIRTGRCLISGFPISRMIWTEFYDMVTHTSAALQFDALNELDSKPTEFQVADALETMLDHMKIRVIQSYKVGPSLSYSNGQFAIARLGKPRQLAILVNQLLFDGGMYRDKYAGIEDVVYRNVRSATMADVILDSEFENDPNHPFNELHAALIELDAKYRINRLEWHGRKEHAQMLAFRNGESLDPVELTQFVMEMIAFRDEHNIGLETTNRWSQDVYKSNSFEAAARLDKSNLIETVKVRDYKVAPSGKKAAVTPEAKAKEAKKARIMGSIDSVFAQFNIKG